MKYTWTEGRMVYVINQPRDINLMQQLERMSEGNTGIGHRKRAG